MTPKKILIVSGEPSGDLHASNLVKDLKELHRDIIFFGLGGRLSKEAGVDIVFNTAGLAIIGILGVFKNLFTIGKVYKRLLAKTDEEKPDFAILVDYPGFNLRLARALRKRSIPVIYYISPQVWAWGRGRIALIKQCVKKIIVFFKFEEELYKTYDIDAEFVGNPLLDTVKATATRSEVLRRYTLSEEKITIALLPGSRLMEVKSLLPIMLGAAKIIDKKMSNTQYVIAKHRELPLSLYEEALKGLEGTVRVADGDTYNVVSASDFAIVASGTATLETAILGTPFIIIYKVDLITFLAYKLVATVNFLGLVNVIAGKMVVPELLQSDATPSKVAETAVGILTDAEKQKKMREDIKTVKKSLGQPGARMRSARAFLPFLS